MVYLNTYEIKENVRLISWIVSSSEKMYWLLILVEKRYLNHDSLNIDKNIGGKQSTSEIPGR